MYENNLMLYGTVKYDWPLLILSSLMKKLRQLLKNHARNMSDNPFCHA